MIYILIFVLDTICSPISQPCCIHLTYLGLSSSSFTRTLGRRLRYWIKESIKLLCNSNYQGADTQVNNVCENVHSVLNLRTILERGKHIVLITKFKVERNCQSSMLKLLHNLKNWLIVYLKDILETNNESAVMVFRAFHANFTFFLIRSKIVAFRAS